MPILASKVIPRDVSSFADVAFPFTRVGTLVRTPVNDVVDSKFINELAERRFLRKTPGSGETTHALMEELQDLVGIITTNK